MENIREQFNAYVCRRIPDAENIIVNNIRRFYGGASRETFRLDLSYSIKSQKVVQPLILRLEAEQGGLVETETKNEFNAYKAFYGTNVPVPKPFWLEEDKTWFNRPFLVMEEVSGCQSSVKALLEKPFERAGVKIVKTICEILGRIARVDPVEIGYKTEEIISPDECWKRELDYWEDNINRNQMEPQPILRKAIRWLRGNPPVCAQKIGVVHGDYRAGNVLYNEAGEIRAVLDWEMCHLGDPLEDLAWLINPTWHWKKPEKVAFILPRDDAVKIWEKSSGLKADQIALGWWEVFAHVKCLAIWLQASKMFVEGRNTDPIISYAGIAAGDVTSRSLLKALEDRK
jgi:aminoglycoside phosphotransferase (APT) family kinase protein